MDYSIILIDPSVTNFTVSEMIDENSIMAANYRDKTVETNTTDMLFHEFGHKIDYTYCIKFITFELITLTILADIKPLKLDVPIVNNSGIEVAYPAISPTVFGFKFSVSASFLNVVTNTYFEIITIIPE